MTAILTDQIKFLKSASIEELQKFLTNYQIHATTTNWYSHTPEERDNALYPIPLGGDKDEAAQAWANQYTSTTFNIIRLTNLVKEEGISRLSEVVSLRDQNDYELIYYAVSSYIKAISDYYARSMVDITDNVRNDLQELEDLNRAIWPEASYLVGLREREEVRQVARDDNDEIVKIAENKDAQSWDMSGMRKAMDGPKAIPVVKSEHTTAPFESTIGKSVVLSSDAKGLRNRVRRW